MSRIDLVRIMHFLRSVVLDSVCGIPGFRIQFAIMQLISDRFFWGCVRLVLDFVIPGLLI